MMGTLSSTTSLEDLCGHQTPVINIPTVSITVVTLELPKTFELHSRNKGESKKKSLDLLQGRLQDDRARG
jgi:hypothetical protein